MLFKMMFSLFFNIYTPIVPSRGQFDIPPSRGVRGGVFQEAVFLCYLIPRPLMSCARYLRANGVCPQVILKGQSCVPCSWGRGYFQGDTLIFPPRGGLGGCYSNRQFIIELRSLPSCQRCLPSGNPHGDNPVFPLVEVGYIFKCTF